MYKTSTTSIEETHNLGILLGKNAPLDSIVILEGELAAGKTTFAQGFVVGATQSIKITEVTSPTFVYLNSYQGAKTVHHFDLYRLKSFEEFLAMGFEGFLFSGEICCIEWAERIKELLPEDLIKVTLSHQDEHKRNICISGIDTDFLYER